MKSSIKIELVPIGAALEPVIKVKVSFDTEDVRDFALNKFFDSQGYDSNTLVVKRAGETTMIGPDGYRTLEIYPVSNLLVDRWPERNLSGIRITANTEEVRNFLDKQEGVTYTNDGENITVFNVQELFRMGADFAEFCKKETPEETPKYNYVYGNSIAFLDWLRAEGIEHDRNVDHYTGIDKTVDLFDLGVKWEKYRELNEPKKG